jgi:hypothetical protein
MAVAEAEVPNPLHAAGRAVDAQLALPDFPVYLPREPPTS